MKREQLQAALGSLGEVQPYTQRATGVLIARGWYARVDGELVHLGDHFIVACQTVGKLRERAT